MATAMSMKSKSKPVPGPATRKSGTGAQMVAAMAGKVKPAAMVKKKK